MPDGVRLADYQLEEELGRGAASVVYRARSADGRIVAIKVLDAALGADNAFRARFAREVRVAHEVRERHLVRILEAGDADGRTYLVLEYVPGGSLADRLKQGTLGLDELLRLVSEVAAGLDALHRHELVHRDVKSSNIMLREDGSAALTDFGLAKGAAYTVLTRPGQVLGTLDYLAPELVRGQAATPASDIYALGCVAFECLAGTPPFADRSLLGLATAQVEDAPPDPPASPELAEALLRGLAKDPADRPPTATMYAHLLRAAAMTSRTVPATGVSTGAWGAPGPGWRGARAVDPVAFMTANLVARETGWAMHGWSHGDRATNEFFAPLETYGERIDTLLDGIRGLGFHTIDLWGAHLSPDWATDEHVSLVLEALARHGLAVSTYATWVGPATIERSCELALALGTRIIGGGFSGEPGAIAPVLSDHAVTLAVENHHERAPAEVLARIDRGEGTMAATVDTGWWATQGYDPARAIEELGEHVLHVHLKDVLAVGEPHETCLWGRGLVDAEACERALQRLGYAGAMAVEHEPEDYDPGEDCRAMAESLRRWLA